MFLHRPYHTMAQKEKSSREINWRGIRINSAAMHVLYYIARDVDGVVKR